MTFEEKLRIATHVGFNGESSGLVHDFIMYRITSLNWETKKLGFYFFSKEFLMDFSVVKHLFWIAEGTTNDL